MPRISVYRKTPGNLTPGALRFFMKLRSSLIQTLLSVLEFRMLPVTRSTAHSGSRTIPPVGNSAFCIMQITVTLPRRISFYMLYYTAV